MARRGSRRRKKKTGGSTVSFSTAVNDNGNDQNCVYAMCHGSGVNVGPIWGHTTAAVKRVLATLTENCDCPAEFHSMRDGVGERRFR